MAQSKKSSASTKSGKKTSSKSSSAKKSPSKAKNGGRSPVRREIGAVLCLILGFFTLIGYFTADGVFIGLFCNLIKGFIGWGFYGLTPALFICAAILGFHRGRPVRARVVCTLCLTIVLGALLHLFFCKNGYELGSHMIGSLWADGVASKSGGVLSGSISEAFKYLFSTVGAAIVFICSFLAMLLIAVNKTLVDIIDAYKNRNRLEYEPQPEPEPEPYIPPEPKRPAEPKKKRRQAIDIPLDDGDTPAEPVHARATVENITQKIQSEPESFYEPIQDTAFYNAEPASKASAQHTAAAENKYPPVPESRDDNITSEIISSENISEPDDISLDIPFMDIATARNEVQHVSKPMPYQDSHFTPPERKADAVPDIQIPRKKPTPEEISEVFSAPETTVHDGHDYSFPPLDLLEANSESNQVDGSEEVHMNSERLEAAFKSFGINVKICNCTRGPTVTRYEAELEAGVKLNKITGLADDIALSLGASGVRIAAMPNKISTVGIEVPNKLVSKVLLRDIIDSKEFKSASSKLTFAIGKNISGECVVGDISKLPHMLVAGTTGSGKSVCLNSLILSILYKSGPDDVRFIMIDPKMVEFRVYNGIPHLLVPVVTEVKKAAGALQWAMTEMMKRYKTFSESNARDLKGYNKLVRESGEGEPMPQIVIVIDELADLMMTAAKEVEESICRIAQMGRAAGMHLVIATQSPRADVITGLMKANIPSRISLKVSSSLESRIILDAGGSADKLVGNGDMLYAPIGAPKPIRIQGTWVSDEEREQVVEFIKRSSVSQYSEDIMQQIDQAAAEKGSGGKHTAAPDKSDYDEMLPQAADVIFESGQASVSMLQRRLKLGFSRAARIVDQLAELGVVGPSEGSKPRQVLMTRQQWMEMQYVNGTAPEMSRPSAPAPEPVPVPVPEILPASVTETLDLDSNPDEDDFSDFEDIDDVPF